MNSKKKKSLAYAVALAVSFAVVPGTSYAADAVDTSATEDTKTAATNVIAEAAGQATPNVAKTQTAPATTAPATQSATAESAQTTATEQTASTEATAVAATQTPGVQTNITGGTDTVTVTDTNASASGETQANGEQATSQTAEKKADEKPDPMIEWAKNRPEEQAITDYSKPYEGQTIVDVLFDGASEASQPTAKAALAMRTGDMFTTNGLNKDREAIYNTGYFYDLYPTFQKVPEGVIITYHVLENPILQSVKITGNTVESDETLENLLTLKTGEILNSRTLQENTQAITGQYRKDGYILAKVTDMNIDHDGNLLLRINEGMLEGYKVKGNKKTKDRVILREMRQKPGEPFNSNLARRSLQRVYNLGFFEDINIKMNPGVEPNAVVMEIDVKEKPTGTFGIGAGYSSTDGVVGMVSIGDTNFRGTGDAVSLMYEHSGDDSDAHGWSFSYRHPWLDSKETVGTLRIYNRTYEYTDYDTNGDERESYMRNYKGGEITLGRPISEYSTNYITLRNRKDSYVKHEDDGYVGPQGRKGTQWEKDNFGTTRSITFENVTDTRDNIYNPTSGGRMSLSGEFGGFGGDFDFQKYTIEGNRYVKAGRNQVWAMRAKYGYGHGDLSEFNQYRIGGQNDLRGYRDDQFRGDRMILGTLEYRFPIIKKVQGALFTDWGDAWNGGAWPDDFHGSVGVGLSLNTPIGPLRLDYGRGDDGGRVHFSVGGTF